jgi:hypothetical protein
LGIIIYYKYFYPANKDPKSKKKKKNCQEGAAPPNLQAEVKEAMNRSSHPH